MPNIVPIERIENRIFQIRGKRVMLDRDLAELYSVSTKVLNQSVKRNLRRFPDDFMFKFTTIEKHEVVTNCDHLKVLKFSPQLPYAFTEQGVAMPSSVLSSERAIMVNIQIMRAFINLRRIAFTYVELKHKIEAMEKKYDGQFKVIFKALKELLEPPKVEEKKKIGFHRD